MICINSYCELFINYLDPDISYKVDSSVSAP